MIVRLLQRLGGTSPELIEQSGSGGRVAACLGGTVVVTATLATAAFAIAVHDWLHAPAWLALLIAPFWGLAILNLDMLLLSASRRQATWWLTVLMATPRVLLAIVISLVIAEPLVQRIFVHEITAQALVDRQQALTNARQELDREYRAIPQLQAEQSQLQQTLSGANQPTFADNPDWRAANTAVATAQNALIAAETRAGCEAGGSCGTLRPGCGPVCHADLQIVSQRRAELTQDQQTLSAITHRLERQSAVAAATDKHFAAPELQRVDDQLAQLRTQKQQALNAVLRAYSAPIGLLDREQALSHLSAQYSAIGDTTWLIRALLISIDLVPILIKTLLLTGRPSGLERAQEEAEDHEHERVKSAEDARDRAFRIEAELPVREAEIRKRHAEASLERLHSYLAPMIEDLWRQQIDDWHRAAQAQHQQPASNGSSVPPQHAHSTSAPGPTAAAATTVSSPSVSRASGLNWLRRLVAQIGGARAEV